MPLAGDCLGGELPALDDGLHGGDRKTAESEAFRDRGLWLLLGCGAGSRVSRHRLDVSEKSAGIAKAARRYTGFHPVPVRHLPKRNLNLFRRPGLSVSVTQVKAIRRFTVRTVLPESIRPLARLATNLRWSWHRPTRELFEGLNPGIWAESAPGSGELPGPGQPRGVPAARSGPGRGGARPAPPPRTWTVPGRSPAGTRAWATDAPSCIAYFSPEFGITEVLPQYSGGLGILAGDHLKAASDLGVPLIGVGLLYQAGYFKQSLSRDAWQQETYPVLDPDGLPLTLLREAVPGRQRQARSRSRCRSPTAGACWRTSGGPTSGVSPCCCWTPTFRATTTPPAASPTGSTAAAGTTGSSRNCCWAWAG